MFINNPKISLIIPVYNVEKYVNICLNSIIHQLYKNLEIIVINDGSKDSSGIICEHLSVKDNRITYISTENKGASHARNIGIEAATGEYIWFIDADDWIDNEAIGNLLNELSSDIIFFGFNRIFSNGASKKCQIQSQTKKYSKDIPRILNNLFNSTEMFFGYTWNKIFKRDIIIKYNIRFKEDLIIKEDEVFTLEYCRHIQSLTISSIVPYNYRMLSSSISHSKKRKRNMFNLALYIKSHILPDPLYRDLYPSLTTAIFSYLWYAAIEESNSSRRNEAIDLFIDWLNKNKFHIAMTSNQKLFSLIPTNFLKKTFILCYLKILNLINKDY